MPLWHCAASPLLHLAFEQPKRLAAHFGDAVSISLSTWAFLGCHVTYSFLIQTECIYILILDCNPLRLRLWL